MQIVAASRFDIKTSSSHFVSLLLALVHAASCSTSPFDFSSQDDHIKDLCKAGDCAKLRNVASCWNCSFPPSGCAYGEEVDLVCVPHPLVTCSNKATIREKARCEFCFQGAPSEHHCLPMRNCTVVAAPPQRLVETSCRAKETHFCVGNRLFRKRIPCNFTTGYKWSTAFILSVTLGGFGADRFYLGLWREALGKLFSFGGLGVWTLLDVILIGVGYVGPADGSVYM